MYWQFANYAVYCALAVQVPVPSLYSDATKSLTIVIPAYNEAQRITLMLDETMAYLQVHLVSSPLHDAMSRVDWQFWLCPGLHSTAIDLAASLSQPLRKPIALLLSGICVMCRPAETAWVQALRMR